ncbi:class I SAM-dependent methyltransferase [Brevibacterium daeguense]|uniref:Class I SAM-dependent methyltransferase n=1 Tax=Brevibacterium daeguense TaxID=909936 RepID=A0ABP8EF60_9MICO|nr:class I SAM-dependent methyltransferase [Brevibacterium daeguense]
MDEVVQAYRTNATRLAGVLGTEVSPQDPDRAVIEPWARTVSGPILDVGAGTGRWTGHLAALGHDVEGLEPVDRFVELARRAHPTVPFRHASLADLEGTDERWSGILAWYSLIHLRPDELPTALSTLRGVLNDGGSLLASFFSGPRIEAFQHPAATAYRWPMTSLVHALKGAGFEVTAQQWHPRRPHATVTARAS